MKKTLRIQTIWKLKSISTVDIAHRVPLAENPLLESILKDKRIMHGSGICVQNIIKSLDLDFG